MSEFLFPTYREWLQEYRALKWEHAYDRKRWDPSTVYSHVSPIIRELFSLPAQRDYYRPERAALLLETMLDQPASIKHGILAFAAWMVRQRDVHRPTNLMGAEICKGTDALQKRLKIPLSAVDATQKLLGQYGQTYRFKLSSAVIFDEWFSKTQGKIPLATWLRSPSWPSR